MRILQGSTEGAIDPTYDAEHSVVLRYRNAFTFGATEVESERHRERLASTSIREGARVFPLLTHRGVEVAVLDETSRMQTRTMRSISGCVITARCLEKGYRRIVFESGGNLGEALVEYACRAGIEPFLFIPEENVPLLHGAVFAAPNAHLIAVAKPGLVKESARRFCEATGIPHIPQLGWRYESARFRGMFMVEHMRQHGRYDWIAQTVSAAFGPIGFYSVLEHANLAGGLPRFLGVQQQENCPMVTAWRQRHHTNGTVAGEPIDLESTNSLLSRVLYDVRPHTYGTRDEFFALLDRTGGALTAIDRREFNAALARDYGECTLLDGLARGGVTIPMRHGVPIESTGLMALVGVLQQIDQGTIAPGARVLVCLTSGQSRADGRAQPRVRIPAEGAAAAVAAYARQVAAP